MRPLEEAKRYLETQGRMAFLGALGEERVLAALGALPDPAGLLRVEWAVRCLQESGGGHRGALGVRRALVALKGI